MCLANECYLREVGFGFENSGERGFSRGHYIPYPTVNCFAQKHNYFSVFYSAYRYDVTEIDKANLFGDLYLDFDNIQDFSQAQADAITTLSYLKVCYHISEDNVLIYFSGNKGIHIIVPTGILGVEPTPLLNGIYKYIANSIKSFTKHKTIDTQIYDNKRLFRIPNTIHEKSGLYKIPITATELRSLTEEEIRRMAASPRVIEFKQYHGTNAYAQQQYQRMVQEFQIFDKDSKKDRKFHSKYDFTPPCIQHILENGAIEGQRNITIACLTGFCKNSGKSLTETIDFISEWNSRNIKPTGERELEKTVRSIFLGDKQFGCSTLRSISVCVEAQCKLAKKERKK